MKELLLRKANYNNTSNQPNVTQSSSAKRDQMQKFVWIFQNQNDFCEFYKVHHHNLLRVMANTETLICDDYYF